MKATLTNLSRWTPLAAAADIPPHNNVSTHYYVWLSQQEHDRDEESREWRGIEHRTCSSSEEHNRPHQRGTNTPTHLKIVLLSPILSSSPQ